MGVKKLGKKWNKYGKVDPLWTILTYEGKDGNKWDEKEFFQIGLDEIKSVMAYIDSLQFSINKGNALDFGCGVGRLSQALAEYFEHVDGVDIADSMIELARKYNNHGDKCSYHVNKEDNLSLFPDNHFDFIYTNIVLQHIEPKFSKNYIKEFIRVLKPGGLLIFQQPSGKANNKNLKSKFKRAIVKTVPVPVLDFLFKLKYGQLRMDVFGIPKQEVEDLISSKNARLIDTVTNENTGSGWVSISYAVTK